MLSSQSILHFLTTLCTGQKAHNIALLLKQVAGTDTILQQSITIFNTILHSGEYPTEWTESIIQPILKSQNKENCYNYHGISLISCIGKLFTIILCNWISVSAASIKLLPEEQFGFRKGRRISDAIFVLHTLAESQISTRGNCIAALLS